MVNVKVMLTYTDDTVEEFTISEDLTVTWTNGKPPRAIKLQYREQIIRLLVELIDNLKRSSIKKFEMEENEES